MNDFNDYVFMNCAILNKIELENFRYNSNRRNKINLAIKKFFFMPRDKYASPVFKIRGSLNARFKYWR